MLKTMLVITVGCLLWLVACDDETDDTPGTGGSIGTSLTGGVGGIGMVS
jgi:hypothetical protein